MALLNAAAYRSLGITRSSRPKIKSSTSTIRVEITIAHLSFLIGWFYYSAGWSKKQVVNCKNYIKIAERICIIPQWFGGRKRRKTRLPNDTVYAIIFQSAKRRYSSVAERQRPKLNMRVRFPLPAPTGIPRASTVLGIFFCTNTSKC